MDAVDAVAMVGAAERPVAEADVKAALSAPTREVRGSWAATN